MKKILTILLILIPTFCWATDPGTVLVIDTIDAQGGGSFPIVNARDVGGDSNTNVIPKASLPGFLGGDITSATGSVILTLNNVNSNVGTYNNVTINAKGLTTAGTNVTYATSGITLLNGLSATTQGFANGITGTQPAFSSSGFTHTLNIPYASSASVTLGGVSKADYDYWNNKQAPGSYLTGVSADSPLSGAGTSASHLIFTNPGYITGNQNISVTGIVTGSGTTAITTSAGAGYYMPSTTDQTNWNAKLTSAIVSLNYLTAAAQTLTTGTTGTAPAFVSSGSTHTLNIPAASGASVTIGGIAKVDYDRFGAKQAAGNYITSLTGGVTASGPGAAVATVVTNANLTGPVISVGNTTSLAQSTGSGIKFVLDTSPTLVTPLLGTPTSGNLANCTFPILNQDTTGTASKVVTTTKADDITYYPTFVAANSSSNQGVDVGPMTYNPSTATLTVTNFAGNASTVTTNANLSGVVTSVGNTTSFGSFASSVLATALTDEQGSGHVVFDTNPTFTTGFTITRDTNAALVNFNSYSDTAGNGPNLIFNRARSSLATPTALITGDTIAVIGFDGYDGTSMQPRSVNRSIIDGPVSAGSVPTGFRISTGAAASGESAYWGSNRNCYLGTRPAGITAPVYNLTFNGQAARQFGVERNTNGAGAGLTINAGGACAVGQITATGLASAPTAGGTGYTLGDVLTISTGNADATCVVTGVSGGIVSAVTIMEHGSGYSTGTGQATTGGTGAGDCTVNITAVTTSLNRVGGNLTLQSGISTGTGVGNIIFQPTPAGSSGSTDNTPTTAMTLKNAGLDLVPTITTYNNIATVSNGVPSEQATVDLTTQAAAKTATTLYTPVSSRMFRISISLQVTRAATTSSVLGGATGVVITYTEPDGSVAQSIAPLLTSEAGAAIAPATGNVGNATTTQSQGSAVIYAKTGVAIQYAIGYTSVGVTSMQYSAHLKCEAL